MKVSTIIKSLEEFGIKYFHSNRVSGSGSIPEEPEVYINTSEGLVPVKSVSFSPYDGIILDYE